MHSVFSFIRSDECSTRRCINIDSTSFQPSQPFREKRGRARTHYFRSFFFLLPLSRVNHRSSNFNECRVNRYLSSRRMTKRGKEDGGRKKEKAYKNEPMKRRGGGTREGMRLMKKGSLIFRENTKSADLSITARKQGGIKSP